MKRLLVCTDGSHYSEVCYAYAAWLAKKIHASIDALYVSDLRQFEMSMITDFSGSIGVQPFQGVFSQLQEIEKEKSRLIKQRLFKILKKYEIEENEVQFHQRTGSLVDCFDEFENDTEGVDIICLGKRGENCNFATEHLGSTMERVVRSSKKPCFITSRKFQEINKVLIAYDGSASVNKAIQYLCRTDEFKNLKFEVVSVYESEDAEEKLARESALIDVTSKLTSSGYSVKASLLEGDTCDVIDNYVVDNEIDLLVMGAYGHNIIRHLIIGSTTSDLIRRCKIPLLLFK